MGTVFSSWVQYVGGSLLEDVCRGFLGRGREEEEETTRVVRWWCVDVGGGGVGGLL